MSQDMQAERVIAKSKRRQTLEKAREGKALGTERKTIFLRGTMGRTARLGIKRAPFKRGEVVGKDETVVSVNWAEGAKAGGLWSEGIAARGGGRTPLGEASGKLRRATRNARGLSENLEHHLGIGDRVGRRIREQGFVEKISGVEGKRKNDPED